MQIISGLLYREEQKLPLWFYILLFIWVPIIAIPLFLSSDKDERLEALIAIGVLVLIELLIIGVVGRLTLTVRWNEFRIDVGFIGIFNRRLRRDQIVEVNVVEIEPFKNFGGIGVRFTKDAIGYIYSGRRGVEIKVSDGKKIVVTSSNPERLAEAIKSMS
jgi:hypothetical protein